MLAILPTICLPFCVGFWPGGRGRAERWGQRKRRGHKQNFFNIKSKAHAHQAQENQLFKSLPLTVRHVQATESRLQAIYDAAKLGLKGDTLALASGLRPEEYQHLCQFDALAEMAARKGKADGEREMADILHKAAREGDAKAALEILKHQHGWVAKQSISVDIDQRISITQALQEAEMRVIEVVDAVNQIQR